MHELSVCSDIGWVIHTQKWVANVQTTPSSDKQIIVEQNIWEVNWMQVPGTRSLHQKFLATSAFNGRISSLPNHFPQPPCPCEPIWRLECNKWNWIRFRSLAYHSQWVFSRSKRGMKINWLFKILYEIDIVEENINISSLAQQKLRCSESEVQFIPFSIDFFFPQEH